MSPFQFNVAALLAGGSSPYSASFEGIAARALQGITSAQFALSYPRSDTFGWDGAGNQELITRPRADLTFGYVYASGKNELNLGFLSTSNGGTSALANLNEERNYYLLANQANQDEFAYSGWNNNVFSLGNGVITKYDFAAAVGQPSTVNVAVEGLNLLIQPSGTGQPLPSINKQTGSAVTGLYTLSFPTQAVGNYFEAAPASIVLTFNTGCAIGVLLSGQNACPITSFGYSISLPRNEVKDMGWAYPNNRPIAWPVVIGIHAEAALSQVQYDALTRFGCPDSGQSFSVAFKTNCSLTDDLTYTFNGAKLDTESISVSVGGGTARVSLNWSLHIYDINRVSNGAPNFFITSTGSWYTSIVFPQVDYVTGSKPLTFNLSTGCYLSILSGPGILDGNNVYVSDEAATVVVRSLAIDGSDTRDLTVTVT